LDRTELRKEEVTIFRLSSVQLCCAPEFDRNTAMKKKTYMLLEDQIKKIKVHKKRRNMGQNIKKYYPLD